MDRLAVVKGDDPQHTCVVMSGPSTSALGGPPKPTNVPGTGSESGDAADDLRAILASSLRVRRMGFPFIKVNLAAIGVASRNEAALAAQPDEDDNMDQLAELAMGPRRSSKITVRFVVATGATARYKCSSGTTSRLIHTRNSEVFLTHRQAAPYFSLPAHARRLRHSPDSQVDAQHYLLAVECIFFISSSFQLSTNQPNSR